MQYYLVNIDIWHITTSYSYLNICSNSSENYTNNRPNNCDINDNADFNKRGYDKGLDGPGHHFS